MSVCVFASLCVCVCVCVCVRLCVCLYEIFKPTCNYWNLLLLFRNFTCIHLCSGGYISGTALNIALKFFCVFLDDIGRI